MRRPFLLVPLLLPALACTGKSEGDDTASLIVDDGPHPADLAPLSTGECPDLSASGTSTFSSSGDDRQVTVVIPSTPGESMGLNFFFHGVTDPATTDNPGGETADGLGLQQLADDTNTVWVVPDAPVQDLYGIMSVYLWDLALTTDHDLVLYDDLRTCVAQAYSIDLTRQIAMGFSGGALWTTVIASHRADTLAAAIELSGGSDIEAPGYKSYLSAYSTPSTNIPVLLTNGNDTDVWPSTSFVIVDFNAASDTLQQELTMDGHLVVRCNDDKGHVMDRKDWDIAQEWASVHTFGEPSPFADGDLGGDSDWCTVATAG